MLLKELKLKDGKQLYIKVFNSNQTGDTTYNEQVFESVHGLVYKDELTLDNYSKRYQEIYSVLSFQTSLKSVKDVQFIIDGEQYYFQADLSTLTMGQLVDFMVLTEKNIYDNLDDIISIFFFGDKAYTNDKRLKVKEHLLEHLNMDTVNGLLVFFCLIVRNYITNLMGYFHQMMQTVQ